MQIHKLVSCFIVFLLGTTLFGAELQVTDSTSQYLLELKGREDRASLGLFDNQLLVYKVTRAKKSEKDLLHYTSLVQTYGNKNGEVKFDEHRGMYFFYEVSSQPLFFSDEKALGVIKKDAEKKIKLLLGDDSKNFVFANTETDWTQTIDNPTPRILTHTFRFIRKIAGRYIADNTAYVKIGYTGNNQMAILEIVNPKLEPMPLKKMIKLSTTDSRLKQYAMQKNTVTSVKGNVKVNKIIAQKGTDTYYNIMLGDESYLTPHVSFWSTFELADGKSFDSYINFSLDEETTPNLVDDVEQLSDIR